MWRILQSLIGVLALAAAARASPFWIRYDAAEGQFPEEQSWERLTLPPLAQRWFEDDALVIDSRTGLGTWTEEFYRWSFPGGGLNPGPGEEFVMRWRLKIDAVDGPVDPGVSLISDDLWSVGFVFSYDHMLGLVEPNVSIPFAPAVFHTYELRSTDMRHYGLWIDGDNVWAGLFRQYVAFPPARVDWGDLAQGSGSLARWQFYEFGVVPEPHSTLALLGVLLIGQVRGARRANHVRPSRTICNGGAL